MYGFFVTTLAHGIKMYPDCW